MKYPVQQNRLYHDLSYLWPIVSPPEEYAEEAWRLRDIMVGKLGPRRHALLELGVGGGHLLSHLTPTLDATAVDLSAEMLALSAQLNPSVAHHIGDMRSVRLPLKFDVVLVHDAINYMLTEDDLRAAFETAKAHLRPGGIFVAAPDWFKDTFEGPTVLHWIKRKDNLEVTFIEYVDDPDTSDTTIESVFFYVIKDGGTLRVEQDRHQTGLFPKSAWFRLLADGGFTPEELNYTPYDGGYGGNLILGVLNQPGDANLHIQTG
ncbi:MAG: class I SAM-dependent methyltransferase [Chloroflexi bacterium]|nr:class I SAM-dependent methyltransferase [Chloroflexota bacterium]